MPSVEKGAGNVGVVYEVVMSTQDAEIVPGFFRREGSRGLDGGSFHGLPLTADSSALESPDHLSAAASKYFL